MSPANGDSRFFRAQEPVARVAIGFMVAVLATFEIHEMWKSYHVIELYAPPGASAIYDVADRLAVAHVMRLLIIATLLTGWRWSLWLTIASYLIVYVPNPWFSGSLMNTPVWLFLLAMLVLIALVVDRPLLRPWRSPEARPPADGKD